MNILKAPSKKVLQDQIKKINILTAGISAVIAVVSAVLLSAPNLNMNISYMTRDALATGNEVVLAPAIKTVFSPSGHYVLAGIFAVSAIISLLLATRLKNSYDQSLKTGASGYRWVLIGVSAALLLEFVSVLAGINDSMVLKLIGGMILITTILGWLSDRENSDKKSGTKWLAYVVSLFTGAVAWAPLLGSLFGTWFWGLERFGWHIYALSATLFIGFTLYALMQYFKLSGRKGWKEYLFIERNFLTVDLTVKVVVGIILVAAFYN
jgi:hypothetical protein